MSFCLKSSLARLSPAFTRSFQNRAALRPVPPANGTITTPQEFLKAIGRSCETKLSVDSWDALWKTSGLDLRKSGVSVRDRRYIMWCMEKYRQNQPLEEFAHEPKPRKKIRGRGPSVQHGKRIRSRRDT